MDSSGSYGPRSGLETTSGMQTGTSLESCQYADLQERSSTTLWEVREGRGHLRYPLHAGGVRPEARQRGGLQGAAHHRAEAALGRQDADLLQLARAAHPEVAAACMPRPPPPLGVRLLTNAEVLERFYT